MRKEALVSGIASAWLLLGYWTTPIARGQT